MSGAEPLPAPPEHPEAIVYFGSPADAVAPLEALIEAGHRVELVVSAPDRRRSRRGAPTPTPVKAAALELGLNVTDDLDDVIGVVNASDGGDLLGVVVAYGRILSRPLLEALPSVNLHFSLLPRWRGAAPVERALLAGDTTTGVAVMGVEEGLDTGPVYSEVDVAITPTSTVAALRAELSSQGAGLLVDTLAAGLSNPRPQTGEPTYARKITADDLELAFDRSSAVELDRQVRVGGAWTTLRGQRLLVWRAELLEEDDAAEAPPPGILDSDIAAGGVVGATGGGGLRLVEVQLAGRARQDASQFLRGLRPEPGERLGG